LLVISTTAIAQAAREGNLDAAVLSATDARILLYLVPAAKDVRRTGLDVFFEQATSDSFNQTDYYVFQVFSTRSCEACSANVGFFAVNKHTADVREFDAEERYPLVRNRELTGIQRIIGDAYHITPEVVKRYRDRPIWAAAAH
jgi:hypothetical protein